MVTGVVHALQGLKLNMIQPCEMKRGYLLNDTIGKGWMCFKGKQRENFSSIVSHKQCESHEIDTSKTSLDL